MYGHYRQRAGCPHNHLGGVSQAVLIILQAFTFLAAQVSAQEGTQSGPKAHNNDAPAWAFSFSCLEYIVPRATPYASPVFAVDHHRLHFEARYNYEDQQTGSLWAGYNLSTGNTVVLDATAMVGAVLGSTNGVAPGGRLSLNYKQLNLSNELEYVLNPANSSANFLYSWNELVYSPTEWFHAGLISQRTRAYHTPLDVQRGFLVGFSHKNINLTTYILNVGWTDPTIVLGFGFTF